MNPIEVESVKERLSTDSIVASYAVIREFAYLNEGFIRVRAILTNSDFLFFISMFAIESAEIKALQNAKLVET